jgi:hypothetical protein
MKCSTLLCGGSAKYENSKTKEKKCATCMQKRVDRDSPLWAEISKPEGLVLPPAKRIVPYSVCELSNGKYGVRKIETDVIAYVAETLADAGVACVALNNAFKYGASSVLHKMETFSLDMRRKHGILWGDGRNDTDH